MEERFEVFTGLINEIGKYIRKIKTQEMQEFDLKSSHVSCLYYLFKRKSLTVTELSFLACEDKASISRTLDSLSASGFIVRTEEVKRYKSPVVLTGSGEQIGEKIAVKVDKVLSEVSGGLTDSEREDMYKYLEIVKENLKRLASSSATLPKE